MTVEEEVLGETLLVGIRMDGDGRDLLIWSLAKVAAPGDRVVALHVCRRNSDYTCSKEGPSDLLVQKELDVYLALYKGFCSMKKVSLVGHVSWGNSIRKVIVHQAIAFAATTVVVGLSRHNTFGGSVSLAKYCAKRLPQKTMILGIHNGKVFFQKDAHAPKESSGLTGESRSGLCRLLRPKSITSYKEKPEFGISKASKMVHELESRSRGIGQDVREGMVEKDGSVALTEDDTGRSSSYTVTNTTEIDTLDLAEDDTLHVVHEQTIEVSPISVSLLVSKLPEAMPGWPLLRKAVSTTTVEGLKDTEARKLSVVQWVMNLPNRSFSMSPLPQFENQLGREFCRSDGKCSQSPLGVELTKELEAILARNSSSCRWFRYKDLKSFTAQFSSENLIGKGGCGKVYKGRLPSGQQIAVKIIKTSQEVWKNFLLEIDIITTLQHKNILPLIGVCVENNDLISVYNLLSRGSLEENLHGEGDKPALTWEVRFKVAIGIAEALSYMHSGCPRPVIHRDVKSSNILLSNEFGSLLSDFGLATWAPTTSPYVTVDDILGTFGYLAPEYFMYGKVSDKIDVYSYGVVLLELLSGRKSISPESPKGKESLVMWAMPLLDRGDVKAILDPNLAEEFEVNQMQRMVLAASLCIRRTARLRPQMSQIVEILQGNEGIAHWVNSNGIPEESDNQDEEAYPHPSFKSPLLDLALLEGYDDGLASVSSSIEQSNHNSLEDYLHTRCSRSSSFD